MLFYCQNSFLIFCYAFPRELFVGGVTDEPNITLPVYKLVESRYGRHRHDYNFYPISFRDGVKSHHRLQ